MSRKWLRYPAFLTILVVLYLLQERLEIATTFSLASPALSSPSAKLTIVTYNIRGCRDDQGEADYQMIAEEITKLGADIIALQEVDNRLPRSNFINQAKEIARRLHMNYVYAPAINFLIGTYGNAIMSRYPIVSFQAVQLPFSVEPRELLDVTLAVDGYPLHIYSTHLGLKKSERIEQFHFLYDYLQEKTGTSAIFLGDFNTKSADSLLTPVRTLFQDPLFKNKHNLVTINGKTTYGMIDHIFLSPDLTFVNAYSPLIGRSDHYPIILELELPEQRKSVPPST